MKKLVFLNQKGGVGKTTSALNVSAALAREGYRVLMIDMDGQANLTSTYRKLLSESPNPASIFAVLDKGALPDPYKISENLHLIHGDKEMFAYDRVLMNKFNEDPSFNMQTHLKEVLEQYPLDELYDFIIFDAPPKLDLICTNILMTVDWVFIPANSDTYSIDAVEKTVRLMQNFKKANPNLNLGGIFLTRFNPASILYKEIRAHFEDVYGDFFMKSFTRENVSIREAIYVGMDVFAASPESNGAKDYNTLTHEILNQIESKVKVAV